MLRPANISRFYAPLTLPLLYLVPTKIDTMISRKGTLGSFRRRRFHGNSLSSRRDASWRLPVGPGYSSSSAISDSAGFSLFSKTTCNKENREPNASHRHARKHLFNRGLSHP